MPFLRSAFLLSALALSLQYASHRYAEPAIPFSSETAVKGRLDGIPVAILSGLPFSSAFAQPLSTVTHRITILSNSAGIFLPNLMHDVEQSNSIVHKLFYFFQMELNGSALRQERHFFKYRHSIRTSVCHRSQQ